MPSTIMKVKSGNKYPVKYRVVGDLSSLTREQLEAVAIKQFRMTLRNFCIQQLNEAEPAVVTNLSMRNDMVESGVTDIEKATAFFVKRGLPLEIPDTFEVPLSELLPGESTRGKKAADIFTFEAEDDNDEGEDATE